ncbi:MAG: AAA family ATPase [Acidobacteria bacterium]|nr:AAA family ATPase [Acidobacteriota bacterium]
MEKPAESIDSAAASLPLRQIQLRSFLSYGPDSEPLELRGLNVLIGPNGSGKSNLIEAISLLRATAGDLRKVVQRGGGVTSWIWKGDPEGAASIEALLGYPPGGQPLRHGLSFRAQGQSFVLEDESIENEKPYPGNAEPFFYYRYQRGRPVLNVAEGKRQLQRESVEHDASILSQRKDPDTYPEITFLSRGYEQIRIYREWVFGRDAVFRSPQQADMREVPLEEDFSNLGLFLNQLRLVPAAKEKLLLHLRELYDGIDDFEINVKGGFVQVFFQEGDYFIPATRLSDGTLRYLCLLAILCDPEPPPLVCIEEPELGLHPDVLPKLVDLMVEVSQRTQLIVTTHSDIFVDALTETPEAVLVCEKHQGRTEVRRLDPENLSKWLESYRLGELWTRGELGGTRW